jgi:cytochrome c oxidase cbb3-type subunit 1
MQGLMWREYDEQGFLVYSFAETVAAMHPYYVIRAAGRRLLPEGGLIMAYNMWRPSGPKREKRRHTPPGPPALRPNKEEPTMFHEKPRDDREERDACCSS